MPQVFWGNYEFEHELANDRQNLPFRLQRLNAELACCWMAVAEEGDRIWCPQTIDDGFFARMHALGLPEVHFISDANDIPRASRLVPWGWSRRARSSTGSRTSTPEAPDIDVVRAANSRRFNLSCEIDWGVAPFGVSAVESVSELESVLKRSVGREDQWVLKAEFSHAGRERVLGQGRHAAPDQIKWAAKRLDRDGVLFYEPWFERCAEAGLQWTVPEAGQPVLVGITPLLTDAHGQYCGSRFSVDDESICEWESAIEVSERAVRQLQKMGYHGPVGIDALRYRDANGEERLRPLQDINARWTMGRLSLGWRRVASSGVWRHGTPQQFSSVAGAKNVHCVSTSPEAIDDKPVQHVTWLEFSS